MYCNDLLLFNLHSQHLNNGYIVYSMHVEIEDTYQCNFVNFFHVPFYSLNAVLKIDNGHFFVLLTKLTSYWTMSIDFTYYSD